MRNAGVAIVGDLFVRLNTCNAMPAATAQQFQQKKKKLKYSLENYSIEIIIPSMNLA